MAVAVVLSILLVSLPIMATGLVCYENDDSGNVHTVNGTKYRFCGLIPATTSRPGRLFALGEENDYFPTYEKTFGVSDPYYRVITVCLLEEFQFGRHYPKMHTEFIFRCVCNFDLCNAEPTFSEYLNAIKISATKNESKPIDITPDRLI
uniref:DM10 domain-containing protein n=2 Tax=Steinernema glaseri TaxID=37863 RepID=A0A1I8ANV5_9BILA